MNSVDANLIKNGTIGNEAVAKDNAVDKVYYICPHCYATLLVDKAKEVSGFKWCPNCGTKMRQAELYVEETIRTDTKLPVSWNEEWTRQ